LKSQNKSVFFTYVRKNKSSRKLLKPLIRESSLKLKYDIQQQ